MLLGTHASSFLNLSGKLTYIFVDPSLAEFCTGYTSLGGDEGTKKQQLKDNKILLTILHLRK